MLVDWNYRNVDDPHLLLWYWIIKEKLIRKLEKMTCYETKQDIPGIQLIWKGKAFSLFFLYSWCCWWSIPFFFSSFFSVPTPITESTQWGIQDSSLYLTITLCTLLWFCLPFYSCFVSLSSTNDFLFFFFRISETHVIHHSRRSDHICADSTYLHIFHVKT